MERGHSNPIEINLLDELGALYKVTVMQDGSNLGSDWHLDRIELGLVDLVTGEVMEPTIFKFDMWIKTKQAGEHMRFQFFWPSIDFEF